MSTPYKHGVAEKLSKRLRRLHVHPARRRRRLIAGSRCRAGAYAERMSIDDRGPAERSELMVVVVLDSTAARFGRRSLWDAPSGVTVRLSHVARSLSAMTSSSGKKYNQKINRSMNRGLQ